MKTGKSPNTPESELTPSKKKLKQARLPFKLISDVSPSPVVPQTRKRKLSAPETETVNKVGKISKENELAEQLVVISDDDSNEDQNAKQEANLPNPFVKLVDAAWKKKLQKKASKKKKNSKTTVLEKESENATDTGDDKESGDCEKMEVDEPVATLTSTISNARAEVTENIPETESTTKTIVSNIVILEDSNSCDKSSKLNITESKSEQSTKKSLEKEAITENSVSKVPTAQITPKRSTRNISENIMSSPSHAKLNESIDSDLGTPRQTRSPSVTNSQGDESLNDSTASKNLTPKQLQKKFEFAKKKEEKEKERLEREKKKQQEKEERAKQRLEKEEQKKKEREEKEEAKKKEREEKEEQKKKEREEKDKQKELEKKLREEKEEQKKKEKEEKEEQRRKEKEAKEEEKRKKQEALELEKQEQEFKKKKAAEAFVNFFVPKHKCEKDKASIGPTSKNSMLSSFSIKVDMRLAPTTRTNLSEEQREELDNLMNKQSDCDLYIRRFKNGISKPMSSGKTWPLSEKDNDVMIVEDELPALGGAGEIITCDMTVPEKLRPKFLSFHENRRPPYWGTWRKKSGCVKPRKPFGQDQKHLDYEVDSDEEWEEEQEGESLDGSAAGSDDEQEADEYEVDNEVFVPHGYLSDEEATVDEDDVLAVSPETQKARLKFLEDEFELEMKKPTEKLKPRLYGILWETEDGGKPENCADAIWNHFQKLAIIMDDPTPFLQPSNEPDETEKKKVKKKKVVSEGEQSPKQEKKKKIKSQKSEEKETKLDSKKNTPDPKKSQLGINMFLTKIKNT